MNELDEIDVRFSLPPDLATAVRVGVRRWIALRAEKIASTAKP